MTARIQRESVEKLETVITSDADPTGLTVEFAFAQGTDRPSTWTAGTWDGTWSSSQATAVTPTIGGTGSGAAVELAAGSWTAYVKVTGSPEIPVMSCGQVVVA